MCSGRVAVISLVVIIIVLFGLSCFLMSIVNPDKLPVKQGQQTRKSTWSSLFYPVRKIDDLRNSESLIPFYRFGVFNKTEDDEDDLVEEVTLTGASILNSTVGNLTNGNGNNSEVIGNVSKIVRAVIKRRSIKDSFDRRAQPRIFTFEDLSGKTGVINVKVLDELGNPRIEIKLNTNRYFNRKEKLSLEVSGVRSNKTIELEDNTDIRIMPNDTIAIQSGLGNDHNVSILNGSREVINNTEVDCNNTMYRNKNLVGEVGKLNKD